MGEPVSSYWFSYEYGTDYGIEHFTVSSPSHFAMEIKNVIEKHCDNKPCDLEELIEYLGEEYFLPRYFDEADDCIHALADKFVDEIDSFDGELPVEVLSTLENICTDKKRKQKLQKTINGN